MSLFAEAQEFINEPRVVIKQIDILKDVNLIIQGHGIHLLQSVFFDEGNFVG